MKLTILILLISILQSVFSTQNVSTTTTTDSLDVFLQNSAFNTLVRHRPRTGALYTALLPSNLSGIEASIVRLRSRRLWNVGANFSHFQIPSGTRTMPHVKRLVLVYQDLGNWSSHYYHIPRYTIATSVIGFKVFNASNAGVKSSISNTIKRIRLDTRGRSIAIRFSDGFRFTSGAKCVSFGENESFRLSEVDEGNVCYSRDEGRFAVVVPVDTKGEDRTPTPTRMRKKLWYLWIILVGFVISLGGVCLIGYYVMVSMMFLKSQKIEIMEKQAEEDLVLETIWVGDSKMPFATFTRTQPTTENGDFS